MPENPRASSTPPKDQFVWWRFFVVSAVLIVLTPFLVFCACLLLNGIGVVETLQLTVQQMQAERRNLFLVGLPGVFPFLLLALLIFVLRRRSGFTASRAVALAGGGAIVLMLVWANASFWPVFLPGTAYPGWPHGLEMVIVPVFFAPIAMLFGALLALIWSRR